MKRSLLILIALIVAALTHKAMAQELQQEATSFNEVTEKLQKGGNFYLYLSTSDAIKVLEQQILAIKKIIVSNQESSPDSDDDYDKTGKVFDLLLKVINTSGLNEIDGLGISSIKNGNIYNNRVVVHHYSENKSGIIWSAMGTNPHKLDILMSLPDDTVLAGFTDINAGLFWSWITKKIKGSGIDDLQKGFDEAVSDTVKNGFDIEQIAQSIDGPIGIVITLDKTAKTIIPLPGKIHSIPEPALLLVLKTKDDKIFQMLEQKFAVPKAPGEQTLAKRLDAPDRKTLTLSMGIPFIPGPATFVQTKDYLMIASSPKIVDRMLAVSNGTEKGLTETEEFKELSAGIPLSGNGFKFVSSRFASAIMEFQKNMLKNSPDTSPGNKMIEELLGGTYSSFRFFTVSQTTPDGFVFYSNSSVSMANFMLTQVAVAPTAMMAGMMLPALGASREKARRISCASQLKGIGLGLRMYSQEHNEKYPEADGAQGLEQLRLDGYLESPQVYVCHSTNTPEAEDNAPLTEDTVSYVYFGGFTEADSCDIPIAFDKPSNHKKFINILYVDGHVKGYAGNFNTCVDVIKNLKHNSNLSESDLQKLLDKAKKADERMNAR